MKNFALFALLACTSMMMLSRASTAAAEDFNIRTYGAVADGKTDDRPAIQRAVDAAIKSGKPSRILLPSGSYRLDKNTTSGTSQILIINARSLAFVGSPDTVLISTSPQQHVFGIYNSTDVQIRELKLERRPLLFSQATVKTIDVAHKTARVVIDPGYTPLDSPLIAPLDFFLVFSNPESKAWGDHSAACAFYKPSDGSVCWPPKIISRRLVNNDEWELTLNTEPLQNYVDHKAIIWSGVYKGHAFAIQRSRNVLVSDVTYYGGGGDGGYVITHSDGTIEFRRFLVGVEPESNQFIGSIGGGMIFNNHARFIFDHVTVDKSWDDALNIGANFARIYEQSSPTTLRVDGSRADFRVGDQIAVWNWREKTVQARVRIVGLTCDGKMPVSCLLTLDQAVAAVHAGYAPVRSSNNEGDGIDRVIDLDGVGQIKIIDSNFQSLHARCLLIKASNSSVENTICHDTVMAGLMIGPQFFWDEGPEVHDLVVENNIFRNVSGPNILITNGGNRNAPAITNITIEDNKFLDYGQFSYGVDLESGVPILLQKVVNANIRGNTSSSRYQPQTHEIIENSPDDADVK